MNDYGELVYQLVRFAFTGSLLLFLFLLLKATIRESKSRVAIVVMGLGLPVKLLSCTSWMAQARTCVPGRSSKSATVWC